jgi:hypothetical protein
MPSWRSPRDLSGKDYILQVLQAGKRCSITKWITVVFVRDIELDEPLGESDLP